MTKTTQLYEGKAKKVWATEDPDIVIVDYIAHGMMQIPQTDNQIVIDIRRRIIGRMHFLIPMFSLLLRHFPGAAVFLPSAAVRPFQITMPSTAGANGFFLHKSFLLFFRYLDYSTAKKNCQGT